MLTLPCQGFGGTNIRDSDGVNFTIFVTVNIVSLLPFLIQKERSTQGSELLAALEPTISRPHSPLRSKSFLRRKDRRKPIPTKDNLGSEEDNQEKISCERTHNIIFSSSATRQDHLSLLALGLAMTDICATTSESHSKTRTAAPGDQLRVALLLCSHYWKLKDA